MRRSRPFFCLVACLLPLPFATSLLARGQAWAFMGYTQVDRRQDHSNVQVTRRDCFFRTIRLRVSEAIFFDRLVVHFGNGTSQELIISGRILPEGGNYVVNLPGEPRLLESVDLWYYQESWGRDPRVSLYGIAAGSIDEGETSREH
jgi:hypothetical protein